MNKERLVMAFENNRPNTPLTEEETRVLMNILLSQDKNLNINIDELDKNSKIYAHFNPLINSFQAQVFLKRLQGLSTIKMSLGALIMLVFYMETPGSSVMYAYYIHTKLAPNTLVNMNVFSTDLFPWGMFSKEQLKNIWDAQKVKHDDGLDGCNCIGAHDNLLDYEETWR